MKRILAFILAAFFPWAIFLWEGNLALMMLSLVLQVTIIGWLPMSTLAWNHLENISFFQKKKKKSEPENIEP